MEKKEYIQRVAQFVQKYAPQFGIMVHSPIIAQFILESGYGTTDKVVKVLEDGTVDWRHNYAGLKWRDGRCAVSNEYFEEWTAEQNADKSYTNIVSRFCRFKSLEECVLGYFQWTNIPNYSNLKGVTDPRTYLENIKADGYATSHDYVENLMRVINDWNLTQYDNIKGETDMKKIRICIDAGHFANYNRSPVNKDYYESVMNWKLHLMQKKYLEEYGFEVITTRPTQNADLALQARGKKAAGCDLFISDHSNACGTESVDHVDVYHLTNDTTTQADDISKAIAQKLAPVIASVMGTNQGYKILTRNSSNDRNGDGIMNDNYYGVLHGARLVNVPGLILEHSYHTNLRMTNWLLNDSNLDKLAKAEAAVIAEYFGMSKQDNEPEQEASKEATTNLWRVQAGAFSVKKNATALEKKLKAAGFDTYMVKADGMYKIQIGAYGVRKNAEAALAKVKAAGFDSYITDKGGQAVAAEIVKKSNEEIAKEVIKGLWGNGSARKSALEKAGYNYAEIQRLVEAML